jgi:hypothetical protein
VTPKAEVTRAAALAAVDEYAEARVAHWLRAIPMF